MKLHNTKTALLLASAGAIVGTAILLGKGHAEAVSDTAKPSSKPAAVSCGTGEPKATAAFPNGTMTGALSIGKVMRGGTVEVYAAFDLETGKATATERPPIDIALVIDHSGSMDGDKIIAAKKAALGIVQRLDERDHVSLIQYDDNAEVMVPALATDKAGKAKLAAAIATIVIGGGTNLHDGMVLGQTEIKRSMVSGHVGRVMLLSDGQASNGITDTPTIAAAARTAAGLGVRTTAVGLGTDYNEDLMEAVAEAGRGNYYYAKDGSELDKVMTGELASVQSTVAAGVELRLDGGCGASIATVIGYENHKDGAATVVPMADLFGNDSRKVLVKLQVPVAQLGTLGAISGELHFHDPKTNVEKTAKVALALEIVDDQQIASGSIDKDVMAQVMAVQAAQTMRDAAAAYDRGDVDAAQKMLEGTTMKLEADAKHYAIEPAKAAASLDSLKDMKQSAMKYAPGTELGKNVMKYSKAKARAMTKSK